MHNNLDEEYLHATRAYSPPKALFWLLSNTVLSTLIGLLINGLDGAVIGLYFGILLIAVPELARHVPLWIQKLEQSSQPMRQVLWGFVPSLLRERIAERRAQ